MAWRLTKCSTQVVALAAHGSLVEAGWELSDVFVRVTGVLGLRGPRGRAENPRGLVLLLLCHHAVAVTMVVPMNANATTRTIHISTGFCEKKLVSPEGPTGRAKNMQSYL